MKNENTAWIKNILRKRYIEISTILYCGYVACIYMISDPNHDKNNPNWGNFAINLAIFSLTIFANVIINSLFLSAISSVIERIDTFKGRFLKALKSMLIAQIVLLPVSFILLMVSFFIHLDSFWVSKIIIFTINFIVPIALFFSYKHTTKLPWNKSIAIVALNIFIIGLLTQLIHFI